jgi:hypothetical protein
MHSRRRLSSPTAVINEAFRQSFPLQHDLPPAMSAVLAKLAALEEKPDIGAIASTMPAAEKRQLREPQMA